MLVSLTCILGMRTDVFSTLHTCCCVSVVVARVATATLASYVGDIVVAKIFCTFAISEIDINQVSSEFRCTAEASHASYDRISCSLLGLI